jgi:alpha-tubulin suppressor-like RCC1 family protein
LNTSGQLGDGTTTTRTTPANVSGLSTGAVAIAAGGFHTCAVMVGGGLKCWGYNLYGQLGDGTSGTNRLAPVDVVVTTPSPGPLTGVASVSLGDYHSCVVAAGGAKCWGLNQDSQLGDNTFVNKSNPVDVSGLTSGVANVTLGRYHSCALTTGGGAKCWGFNSYGTLGNNTQASSAIPVDVTGLTSGVSALAAMHAHTCALTTVGAMKCWGYNTYGQLGDNTTTLSTIPVDVAGLAGGVTGIAIGQYYSCALLSTTGVKCWGQIAFYLGRGFDNRVPFPTDVIGLASGVASVAGGDDYTCAVMTGGSAKCWGRNDRAGLGDNSNQHRATPVDVVGLASVAAIAPGTEHTCARDTNGAAWCWGRNRVGQLGNGLFQGGLGNGTPGLVSGLSSGVAAIASGIDHSCALTTTGGVKCWGGNANGQLGDGTTVNKAVPTDVPGLTSGVAYIAASDAFTCAVTTGGAVKCWGWNGNGQLGDGTQTQRLVPTDVSGLSSGIATLSLGESYTCAVTTGGGVTCWGLNSDGQLGDGTTTRRLTPVSVIGLESGIATVTTGDSHTCALTTGGGVKCWGHNGSNKLADGTTISRSTPVDAIGLGSGVLSLATGGSHSCVVTAGHGLKCWGYNGNGQTGTTSVISLPIGDVLALDATVLREISSSKSHTLAVDSTGKCSRGEATATGSSEWAAR